MVLSVKEAYRIVKENDKHNTFSPSMAAENQVHIAFGNDDNIIRGVNKFTGEYGSYSLYKSGKLDGLIGKGKSFVNKSNKTASNPSMKTGIDSKLTVVS